jgi:hypothetical protein
MPRDPRVEHLQRLGRQRRLRAAGHARDTGRLLLALALVGIILGVLLAVPGHGEVRAWVHQVTHSLQVDRVGMLAPAGGPALSSLPTPPWRTSPRVPRR